MNELLKQLTEAVGVSGDEKEVRRLIRDLIADHVAEWRVDSLGNLIARKKGTGQSNLRVMVDAHLDEVGLMIQDIDSDGSLLFMPAGGLDERALMGKVVQVGSQKLTGVIGLRPIHLLKHSERQTVVKMESLRIDIGAKKKEEVNGKVKIGDRATFVTPYQELGPVAIGKAFDNRAGCAALISLLRGDPYPFDVYAAFTVQEEIGLRGAQVASYAIEPDVALILECTPAYDLPSKSDESPNVVLGQGPSVYVMDAHTIQDPRLVSHILQTAEANGIPYQVRQPGGGGTNAGAIQTARGAVSVATIATPGRYLHAPAAMINLTDFANVIRLTDAVLRALPAAVYLQPTR